MTAPLPSFGRCPGCDQAVHYAASHPDGYLRQELIERAHAASAAPLHFDWQCPYCAAGLAVKVVGAAPLILRFDRKQTVPLGQIEGQS